MKEPKLHLVQLNSDVIYNFAQSDYRPQILYSNIKHHRFMGYLVNKTGTALYFEPEDHEGLIIIPHSWIKWCTPIEKE